MGIALSIEEAMEYIGFKPEQKPVMYRLCRLEDFPARKLGRDWRVHKKKFEEWLEVQFKDDSLDYLY